VTEDELLERLRAAATEADPPPGHVIEGARAAHTLARLDGELLELRFDSLVDAAGARTRAGGGARLLRFGTDECTVELEVRGEGPVGVVGQVAPPGSAGVELTSTAGVVRAGTDDLGRFTLDGVPRGPVSLAWTVTDGRRMRTSWVAV
jgi:hypothetical protein